MQGTKDKLHKFIDDGVRQTLEDKLVVLTNLLSERGISLTSQEKSCIVDLDYDDSRYVDQSSTWSNEDDDENESDQDNDDNESNSDDDDNESDADSDENEEDSKSKASHVFDGIVVCNEDGEFSLNIEAYRKHLQGIGRCYICGSCDHTGFVNDADEHSKSFCPNKKAFKRYCLEEIAKL